eukprot:scaffold24818_cov72-Skeletonema_marinoi.AAC.1
MKSSFPNALNYPRYSKRRRESQKSTAGGTINHKPIAACTSLHKKLSPYMNILRQPTPSSHQHQLRRCSFVPTAPLPSQQWQPPPR